MTTTSNKKQHNVTQRNELPSLFTPHVQLVYNFNPLTTKSD